VEGSLGYFHSEKVRDKYSDHLKAYQATQSNNRGTSPPVLFGPLLDFGIFLNDVKVINQHEHNIADKVHPEEHDY
jgi:hypothetical protein